jgi:hypothetical protein
MDDPLGAALSGLKRYDVDQPEDDAPIDLTRIQAGATPLPKKQGEPQRRRTRLGDPDKTRTSDDGEDPDKTRTSDDGEDPDKMLSEALGLSSADPLTAQTVKTEALEEYQVVDDVAETQAQPIEQDDEVVGDGDGAQDNGDTTTPIPSDQGAADATGLQDGDTTMTPEDAAAAAASTESPSEPPKHIPPPTFQLPWSGRHTR